MREGGPPSINASDSMRRHGKDGNEESGCRERNAVNQRRNNISSRLSFAFLLKSVFSNCISGVERAAPCVVYCPGTARIRRQCNRPTSACFRSAFGRRFVRPRKRKRGRNVRQTTPRSECKQRRARRSAFAAKIVSIAQLSPASAGDGEWRKAKQMHRFSRYWSIDSSNR